MRGVSDTEVLIVVDKEFVLVKNTHAAPMRSIHEHWARGSGVEANAFNARLFVEVLVSVTKLVADVFVNFVDVDLDGVAHLLCELQQAHHSF